VRPLCGSERRAYTHDPREIASPLDIIAGSELRGGSEYMSTARPLERRVSVLPRWLRQPRQDSRA